MIRITILIFLTSLCFKSSSQIQFEKGYIIDLEDNKIECLIKNFDWKNNPKSITYKNSDSSNEREAFANDIKEFGVGDNIRYLSSNIQVDRSTSNIDQMTYSRNPEFVSEIHFLRVIIEGVVNFYVLKEPKLERFYFSTAGHLTIEPLVHKNYITPFNQIGENNEYKQRLLNTLKCESITSSRISNTSYNLNSLKSLFETFYKCNNYSYTDFLKNKKNPPPILIGLSTAIGLSNLNMSNSFINDPLNVRDFDFTNNITYRFGLAFEFFLPYNNNKWSAIFEPTYYLYNASLTRDYFLSSARILAIDEKISINYNSIEIPIGIRHYFYLTERSLLFVNAFGVYEISLSSNIELEIPDRNKRTILDINSSISAAIGIGYSFDKNLSLEIRHYGFRELLTPYAYWSSNHTSTTVQIAYKFKL